MNILFCANDIVYPGLELAICSCLMHNKNVNIYVLTMDVDIENLETHVCTRYLSLKDWMKNKLRQIVRYLDGKSHITFIDARKVYLENLDQSVNRCTSFSPFAGLRLCADIFFPHLDNLLYMDCDVAITGNIEKFYNDFCGRDIYYGAYVSPFACNGEGEMVSGVLFMNLGKLKKDAVLARARYNYNVNNYVYPDQMALRDVCDPEPFPATIGYCESLDDFTEGLPLVIHFTNAIEPKIYYAKNRKFFFDRYPFLKYVDEMVHLLDTI